MRVFKRDFLLTAHCRSDILKTEHRPPLFKRELDSEQISLIRLSTNKVLFIIRNYSPWLRGDRQIPTKSEELSGTAFYSSLDFAYASTPDLAIRLEPE